MQTYTVEAAKAALSRLVHLASKGEEVLLTENDKPLAKIVPVDQDDDAYRREVRKLMGFAKGIPPFEREDEDRV